MLIIPAILEKDISEALKQIDRLRGIVPWIHIDVMDSTMTRNSTFNLDKLIGKLDNFNVEVHIMSTEPGKYFETCQKINADRVYFHLGEVNNTSQILFNMDKYDFTKGVVLSPQTSIDDAFSYIDEIDAVQIMTVIPGAQGGKFLESMLEKVSYLRERRTELWIGIDGGVNEKNIKQVALSGVDSVAIGSTIKKSDNLVETIEILASNIEETQL